MCIYIYIYKASILCRANAKHTLSGTCLVRKKVERMSIEKNLCVCECVLVHIFFMFI